MILLDFNQLIRADQAALQSNAQAQQNAIRQNQISNVIPYQTELAQQQIGQQLQLIPGSTQIQLGDQGQQLWQQGQTVNARPAAEATNNYNNALGLGTAQQNMNFLPQLLGVQNAETSAALAGRTTDAAYNQGRAGMSLGNLGATLNAEQGTFDATNAATQNSNAVNLGVAQGTAPLVPQMVDAGVQGVQTQIGTAARTNQLTGQLTANRNRADQIAALVTGMSPGSGLTAQQQLAAIGAVYPGAQAVQDPATGSFSLLMNNGQQVPLAQVLNIDRQNIAAQNNQIISELNPPSDSVQAAQIRANATVQAAQARNNGGNLFNELMGVGPDGVTTAAAQTPGSATYQPPARGQQPTQQAAPNAPTDTQPAPAQDLPQSPLAPLSNTPTETTTDTSALAQYDVEIKQLRPQISQFTTTISTLESDIEKLMERGGLIRSDTTEDPASVEKAWNKVRSDILAKRNALTLARTQLQNTQNRLSQLETAASRSRGAQRLLQGQ